MLENRDVCDSSKLFVADPPVRKAQNLDRSSAQEMTDYPCLVSVFTRIKNTKGITRGE